MSCINTGVLCPLKEGGYDAEKMSPESLQMVQKSTTDVTLGEVTQEEGLPTHETKAEVDVVITEELLLEAGKGSTIFTEIQELAGTGPSTQLIEVT